MDISIRLSNGQLLRGIIRSPGDDIRAIVIFVHGLNDHIQRYSAWIEKFTNRKMVFVGFDLPGHGRSDGKRGHIRSFSLINEMLDTIIKENRNTFPGIPVFLYGYDLGGAIVMQFLLKRNPKIKGAVVTAPWLPIPSRPKRKTILMTRIMSFIYPSYTLSAGLKSNNFSHDQELNEKYDTDPLLDGKMSASLFYNVVKAAGYSLKNAQDLNVPVLMIHGSEDLIASPAGSREFASKSKMAELKIWEGGYHDLHNEMFKDEIFEYIAVWIENHFR